MKQTVSASNTNESPNSSEQNSLKLSLKASELRYRRLFETAQDGILIFDANTGKIIDVHPFLLDLLDYPFETCRLSITVSRQMPANWNKSCQT